MGKASNARDQTEIPPVSPAGPVAHLGLPEGPSHAYQVLFDEHPSMYFCLDSMGKILSANKFGAEQLGYSSDELVGESVLMLFHKDDQDKAQTNLERARRALGETTYWEIRKVRKDGTVRWVGETVRPITGSEGDVIILVACEDITDRKNAEVRQMAVVEELGQLEKVKSVGVLAGGIAHDFNNLLTIILGNISLARNLGDKNLLEELLANAESASLQARDLTQQLLTFSSGGAPIRVASSLEEVVRDSTDFSLRGSNIRGSFNIPEDLWAVDIDGGQISQVLNNLVRNAVDAMPSGGTIQVRIENVTVEDGALPLRAGRYVRTSLADAGPGIPGEIAHEIFNPYFTTKARATDKGMGLGLAICHSIINNHGGCIQFDAHVQNGATFHFHLPASDKPVESACDVDAEDAHPAAARILVMDDEDRIRSLICTSLESQGHETTPASSGDEAVELFQRSKEQGRRFDGAILDLTVPGGMGGQETIERLHDIDPSFNAVVSSGYATAPIMSNYRDFGFCGVLKKPYTADDLNAAVASMLNERIGGKLTG